MIIELCVYKALQYGVMMNHRVANATAWQAGCHSCTVKLNNHLIWPSSCPRLHCCGEIISPSPSSSPLSVRLLPCDISTFTLQANAPRRSTDSCVGFCLIFFFFFTFSNYSYFVGIKQWAVTQLYHFSLSLTRPVGICFYPKMLSNFWVVFYKWARYSNCPTMEIQLWCVKIF